MGRPNISIVIPTYNSCLTLANTIKGCLQQDYPRDRLEIVVVDDGSSDDTRKIVEAFPVIYIYQEKKGPAAARNNGWRHSSGEGVCFIDADCIPHKDWVSTLVQHCSTSEVAAVAGSYSVGDSPYLLDKFVHHEIKYRHSMMRQFTNSFGTYNVFIKRSILEDLGGFDEEYSNASGEDSDISYRIIKSGYKIYFEKDALVSHSSILHWTKYLMIQFRHGYWRMKLYNKNVSMALKDEYAYSKDFMELFLGILVIGAILASFPGKSLLLFISVGSIFILQLPFAVRVSLKEKKSLYLLFSLVTFMRAFVRVAGGILGFGAFWIMRRR